MVSRVFIVLVAALGLMAISCTEEIPPAPFSDANPDTFDPSGGTDCPDCTCRDDDATDCYLAPLESEGTLTCHVGQRVCDDGHWSECIPSRTFTIDRTRALSDGPTECNLCNPDCSISTDYPTAVDLTASRSSNVVAVVDGITSTSEVAALPDADADGVVDAADDCPATAGDAQYFGCPTGTFGIYHELPYLGASQINYIDHNVAVGTADVYFLIDTSASMSGELANLRNGLTTGTLMPGCPGGVVGAVQCMIPDAWFGVGYFDDYPSSPYGTAGSTDRVYENVLDLTASATDAQTAVNSLMQHVGGDAEGSNSQAMWAVATGGALGTYLGARTDCAAGQWGWPCFRETSIPVIVQFTDGAFHQGPSGYNYDPTLLTGAGSELALPASGTYTWGNFNQFSAYNTGDAATTWTRWTGNTCVNTNSYNSVGCGGLYSPEAVFQFTVSTTQTVTITTSGSAYDTVITLTNASFGGPVCNDDDPAVTSPASFIQQELTPGTYYVLVDGRGSYDWWRGVVSNCGDFQLSIGVPSGGTTASLPITWPETVAALNARELRVVTVESSAGVGDAQNDATALANTTDSYDSFGTPLVLSVPTDGSGIDSAVVDLINSAVNDSDYDISMDVIDNPATAIDERLLVESVFLATHDGGCGASTSSSFRDCAPGTVVQFAVVFDNDDIAPTAAIQVFDFNLRIRYSGLEQASIPVRVVVPWAVPDFAQGRFSRIYDSTVRCETPPERPDWGSFTYDVDTPSDSSVDFVFQTADTLSGLSSAPAVIVSVPSAPDTDTIDVGELLLADDQSPYRLFLRVEAVLQPNSAEDVGPTLRGFEQIFICADAE